MSLIAGTRLGTFEITGPLPVYGGESKVLCINGCKPDWSPDAAPLYLAIGVDPPRPILVVPLQPGHAFPEFPANGEEALAVWRKPVRA